MPVEDADMGGTEGAAAAGDEAGRPSRHEPQEAAEIVAVLHRQMMGGRRLAQGEPLRSRLDGADTARMEANHRRRAGGKNSSAKDSASPGAVAAPSATSSN